MTNGRATRAVVGGATVLFLAATASACHGRDTVGSAVARIEFELKDGRFAEADRLAAALDRPGLNTDTRLTSLLVETKTLAGRAAESETLAAAERAVIDNEVRGRKAALELARSLRNLGRVLYERGELKRAEVVQQRALAIRESELGPRSAAVAETLEDLAETMTSLERFEPATESSDRALAIRRQDPTSAGAPLARSLAVRAFVFRHAGDYQSAAGTLDEALAIRRRHAPEHPDVVGMLQLRGEILFLVGEIQAARGRWSEALALGERVLGAEHPVLAAVLRLLAFATDALGERDQGRLLLARALTIGKSRLAPCNSEAIWLLNDEALSKARDFNFPEARTSYERQLRLIEQCGGNANAIATSVVNLAGIVAEIGDLAEAQRLHERAVREWSAALGPQHPYVAQALDGLAAVVAERGRLDEARALYERALDVRRATLDEFHPLIGSSMVNLGRIRADLGDAHAALRDIDQAIAIYRASGPADEPDYLARALELRGQIEGRRANYQRAQSDIQQALAERERVFGQEHPLVSDTRIRLAAIEFTNDRIEQAVVEALSAEEIVRAHLRFTISYLPERHALSYVARRSRGMDVALSAAVIGRAHVGRVFDAVIQSRGRVLDELAARSRTPDAIGSRQGDDRSAVTGARQRYANLLVRSLDDSTARVLLDEARDNLEREERLVAARNLDARVENLRTIAGYDAVKNALPPGAALVSFVQYTIPVRSTMFKGGAAQRPQSLAAFVLGAGSDQPAVIPLGHVADIERRVKAWSTEARGARLLSAARAASAGRAYRAAGARLREAIWDPISPHLKGRTLVFVVPDGAVALVSLSSLPLGESAYLLDAAAPIHYLSAERDLVTRRTGSADRAQGLLALGGATFDGRPTVDSQAVTGRLLSSPPQLRGLEPGCQSFAALRFQSLEGTRDEVHDVARLWRISSGVSSTASLLEGDNATEGAFKLQASRHRVLHLATHGFFLGNSCPTSKSGVRGVGGLSSPLRVALAENPLLLSGLALAGANRRAQARPDDDDGILTAEEVAMLNLQGVEWAVLSACDTGVGEVRAGEGVFGLRRAFQVAGARTVIMSLWSVDDQATRSWMRALYEGRFQRQLSTVDAVHQASLTVLRDRRARGLSTHPFYWAAFVAAGEWR